MANIKLLRIKHDLISTPRPDAFGYVHLKMMRKIMLVNNDNQGTGRIEGIVRLGGSGVVHAPVHVFKRDTKELLWETSTDVNGRFKLRNIAKNLECFVTVFDPTREKNAKIKDMIVAK